MAPRSEMKIKYAGGFKVRLTYEEVVASLALAGWPPSEWAKATAVIAAESDRITNIYNTYQDGHWGLMQISKRYHKDFFKKAQWWSPADNAKEGLKIRKAEGWGAWEAYTNGRYAAYRLQAEAAVKSVKAKRNAKSYMTDEQFYPTLFSSELKSGLTKLMASNVGDAIEGGVEGTGDGVEASGEGILYAAQQLQSNAIFGAITTIIGAAKWIVNPDNWLRVGQVILGGGMVLAGVAIVAKPATQKAISTAAPAVKVIKKVGA